MVLFKAPSPDTSHYVEVAAVVRWKLSLDWKLGANACKQLGLRSRCIIRAK